MTACEPILKRSHLLFTVCWLLLFQLIDSHLPAQSDNDPHQATAAAISLIHNGDIDLSSLGMVVGAAYDQESGRLALIGNGEHLECSPTWQQFAVALRYACLRARKGGGRVALLRVIEPVGLVEWAGVGVMMQEERREEAEKMLGGLAAEHNSPGIAVDADRRALIAGDRPRLGHGNDAIGDAPRQKGDGATAAIALRPMGVAKDTRQQVDGNESRFDGIHIGMIGIGQSLLRSHSLVEGEVG